MSDEHELDALATLSQVLGELDPDARARVLRWAIDKYGLSGPSSRSRPQHDQSDATDLDGFNDLAALHTTARPANNVESALVAAYWLQQVRGASDFDAQTLNAELKHLGHGLTNVTRTLDSLRTRRPALVIQTRKTGSTRQARKRYRVTAAGVSRVRGMIEEAETKEDSVDGIRRH
jgi:hypothetical protein